MKKTEIQDYLAEFVYGGIDGSVTTFAVVAGAAGAGIESAVVIILGFANLIADGFSMSVGSYLSNKSEDQGFERLKRREFARLKENPEAMKAELKEIYAKKGLTGELLEQVVAAISGNKEGFVDTIMKEQLEVTRSGRSPISRAIMTFFAFIVIGFVPMATFVADYVRPLPFDLFQGSFILTGITFIVIGILKSYVNERKLWRGAVETFALGAIAAVLSYYVGAFLKLLVS
jgi:VIT1/CCC1 family predicted Fe2+/Mn2+ transporter